MLCAAGAAIREERKWSTTGRLLAVGCLVFGNQSQRQERDWARKSWNQSNEEEEEEAAEYASHCAAALNWMQHAAARVYVDRSITMAPTCGAIIILIILIFVIMDIFTPNTQPTDIYVATDSAWRRHIISLLLSLFLFFYFDDDDNKSKSIHTFLFSIHLAI